MWLYLLIKMTVSLYVKIKKIRRRRSGFRHLIVELAEYFTTNYLLPSHYIKHKGEICEVTSNQIFKQTNKIKYNHIIKTFEITQA
jgi:hypothetical protein